jgi:hypothetical protein
MSIWYILKGSNDSVITLRITGFLDFVHRPVFKNTRKRNVSETGSVSILR